MYFLSWLVAFVLMWLLPGVIYYWVLEPIKKRRDKGVHNTPVELFKQEYLDLTGKECDIYVKGVIRRVCVTHVTRDGDVEVMYQDAEGYDIPTPTGFPHVFKYTEFLEARKPHKLFPQRNKNKNCKHY